VGKSAPAVIVGTGVSSEVLAQVRAEVLWNETQPLLSALQLAQPVA